MVEVTEFKKGILVFPKMKDKQRLVVWWYGPIKRNVDAESIPLILVICRCLNGRLSSGSTTWSLGDWRVIEADLSHLALVRIGTVLESGECVGDVLRRSEVFDVDYNTCGWRFTSCRTNSALIPSCDYSLMFPSDKTWLLEFQVGDGKKLIVPSAEFFMRCYAVSHEVLRVLTLYSWEVAKEKLFAPLEQPKAEGEWAVKLRKLIRDDDKVFMAHLFYDKFTQRAAKEIYARLEADFEFGSGFIRAAPWFEGPAKLRVQGKWIDNGKTFLGLRVTGRTEPDDGIVIRNEKETAVQIQAQSGEKPTDSVGRSPIRTRNTNIIELESHKEPDRGTGSSLIVDAGAEIIGKRRATFESWHERGKSGTCTTYLPNVNSYSTGEHHGTGKGVGHVSIAQTPIATCGIVKAMWQAMLSLQKEFPESVNVVEWFDGLGYSSAEECQLIRLRPFAEQEQPEDVKPHWLYYDTLQKVTRGVLCARMGVHGRYIHFIEIQRRSRKRRDGGLNYEENIKGFAFVLNDENSIAELRSTLFCSIRECRGTMNLLEKVLDGLGRAKAFRHQPLGDDKKTPYRATILHALKLLDIPV